MKKDMQTFVTLDQKLVLEGYLDGLKNEPCGDNRCDSYRWGHHNGMVDGHHTPATPEDFTFAREWLNDRKQRGTD